MSNRTPFWSVALSGIGGGFHRSRTEVWPEIEELVNKLSGINEDVTELRVNVTLSAERRILSK
jgi:hypothetical protein